MPKRSEPRTSVTFEAEEQQELDAILQNPRYRVLLDELIGDPRGQIWRVPRLAPGASYSSVVRALTRLGLAQLERIVMLHRYQVAEGPDWALNQAELAAVAGQVERALELEDARLLSNAPAPTGAGRTL